MLIQALDPLPWIVRQTDREIPGTDLTPFVRVLIESHVPFNVPT
jgi:hypothetical protein